MTESVLAALAWPESDATAALEALARRAGLVGDSEESRRGVEIEAVEVTGGEAATALLAAGPALLHLPEHGVLAILRSRGRRLVVLAPDQRIHRVTVGSVLALLLTAPAEGDPVKRLLLQERLRRAPLGGLRLLRPPPGGSFRRQARQAGLHRRLLSFVVAYAVSYSLLLGSWVALGAGVLQGRLVPDALAAWGLLLLSLLPLRMVSVWSRARLAIGAGALLKRRLLAGALKLQPEEIRGQGSGQLLGRVIESEAVETLALNGGFLAIVGLIETCLSGGLLAAGTGGGRHVLLLGIWMAVTFALARWFFGRRREWTRERLDMTYTLVEALVGHRTRLVQEDRRRWHAGEDRRVDAYLRSSRVFDASKAVLLAVGPRGWLIVGLVGLLPAFLGGGAAPGLLALGVGGVLTAYRGFQKMSEGFSHLSGAILSWGYATELFRAASRGENEGFGAPSSPPETTAHDGRPVLEALDLSYRHAGRGRPVLEGCTLKIARGDRLLLEGPSGGGKSTLAALLTGLREPASGLVLLDGLDRRTIGDGEWRRRIVLAPQFHENHVFTETFAFNLLMGRGWPPSPADLAEAVEVCRELGLGNLLDRMPSGLQQIVGETGWQLSHGERSRLYMARALLQGAEVVILDESFAALDPENLHQALDCALNRARTLVVIAHP